MPNDKNFPDRFHASADELQHRMEVQDEIHDKPLRNVMEFIELAIRKVIKTLGVDITQEDCTQQQIALGITIAERPPEEMGKLSGFYIFAGDTPIAIIGDAWLGSDGLAWLEIYWIRGEYTEKFGGVRIIQ